jgi:DNA-binding response OmpR family regulator
MRPGGRDDRMCPMTTTCLIGEADPFLARLLERFGEASGLAVVRAKLGQEVLDLAGALKPDVIVVEPELPGTLRGWEAIRAIKSVQALEHIPVITCSWLGEAEACALVGDVDAHLQKPELHYEDFVAALASAGLDAASRIARQSSCAPV